MESILNYCKASDQDDYYAILGCDETSSIEQILCEFKVRSLDCHPDKNLGDPAAVCKFQKLLEAKAVLSDENLRCMYDKWRKSGISMPFAQFQNLSKAAHTSIHWAAKKNKDLMIEGECSGQSTCCADRNAPPGVPKCQVVRKPIFWEREKGNALLEKFRNYEV